MGKSHGNAFNVLRLFAALMVLYSHSFPLYGLPLPVPITGYSYGALAVYAFFAISGFLVSQSWQADPDLKRYWIKRGLRILPGLIVAVVFTALCVGALVTTLPVYVFLKHGDTWAYIANNVSLVVSRHGLPGVFETNPFANAVNASLWTLRYEVLMYFLLSVMGWMLPIHRLRWASLALLVFFAINRVIQNFDNFNPSIGELFIWKDVVDFGVFFFIGCCLNFFKENKQKNYAFLIFGLPLIFLSNKTLVLIGLWILMSGLIVVSSHHIFKYTKFFEKYDISYGVYIYAFPVQQVCVYVALKSGVGWLLTFVVSLLLTLLLGLLSWKWVESPALRLKAKVLQPHTT